MVRKSLPVLGSALLLIACASGPDARPSLDDAALMEEIQETLTGLTEAMNAHDPDLVFSFYRQDPSFLYLGCTNILFGWDTFATRVGPYYTANTEVTFQQEILNIQILSPTVAVATMRGSSTEDAALFWTEVLQRNEAGRWLITYEHESWPGCSVPRGPHMGTEGEGGATPPGGNDRP